MKSTLQIPDSEYSSRRFRARLLAGVLLLNLLVASLAGLSMFQGRQQYRDRAWVVTRNLAQVLEHHLAASLDKVDLALFAVKDEFERQYDGAGLDGPRLNAFMARQFSHQPYLDSLRLADAQGNVVFGTGLPTTGRVSIADRDYFRQQRQDAQGGLVISEPLISRIGGNPVISLSRRLNHADGRFAGIVYAMIPLANFKSLFSSLDLGSQGAVSLRRQDLSLVARFPDALAGSKLVSRQLVDAVGSQPEQGTYLASTSLDGIERANAYRRLAGYPLYVIVGLATSDFLDIWWQETGKTLLLVAIFALVTMLFSGMIYAAWKRREGVLQQLAQQEKKFRTLLNASPDSLVIVDTQGCITMVSQKTEAIFGYGREELIGQPIEKLLPESGRSCHAQRRHDYAAAPMPREMAGGQDLAALTRDGRQFPVHVSLSPIETEQGLMITAAIRDMSESHQAAAALERERQQAEQARADHARHLAELSRHLVLVQEEERRRLALELHDVVSPNLAAVQINLSLMAGGFGGAGQDLATRLDDTRSLLKDTSASLRDICANLRPSTLDYAGLHAALDSYAQQFSLRTGIAVQFADSDDAARLPSDVESLLFRIAQEALTNAAKHARASAITLVLQVKDGHALLCIADNGVGFDLAGLTGSGVQPGLGLLTMRERAEFAGGRFSLESTPGQGTRISVEI